MIGQLSVSIYHFLDGQIYVMSDICLVCHLINEHFIYVVNMLFIVHVDDISLKCLF